jgi:hypothetical protein
VCGSGTDGVGDCGYVGGEEGGVGDGVVMVSDAVGTVDDDGDGDCVSGCG